MLSALRSVIVIFFKDIILDKLCCCRCEKLMSSRTENGSDSCTHTDSCVLDSDAKSISKNSDFMLITENHKEPVALCDGAAVTDVLHERNGNDNVNIPLPSVAAHHIATRSATGRLAKRPRKDLSPARSPPRKIGIHYSFLLETLQMHMLV